MKKIIILVVLLVLCGCSELHRHPTAVDVEYTATDTLRAVNAASVAATPFVPYAGIVASISTILLAWTKANQLSERKKRKYAEGELNRKNGA